MYYEPGVTPHGLPHDPFKSCVIPRPIGWISTVDAQGRHNLAPYNQFQMVIPGNSKALLAGLEGSAAKAASSASPC